MAEITKEIIVTIILLGVVGIVSYIVRLLWRGVFKRIALKTPTKLDIMMFEASERPVCLLVLLFGFRLVFKKLEKYPQIAQTGFPHFMDEALYTLIVLGVGLLGYAIIKAVTDWYLTEVATKTQTTLDDEFLPVFQRIAKLIILFLTLTIILSHFKVNIAGLLGAAGIASLAVAFAAQETLANMISGFTIMIDRPFRVGDRIELSDGTMGDVSEIGLRSTKILSFDNTLIVVPNSEIAKSRITNHSYPDPQVKIRQIVSVAYGTDIEKVKNLLLEICASHPKVLKEPSPAVYFSEFGESSLNLLMVSWVSDYRERFQIIDELNMEIKKKFEEEGIEIPFPQRDIHILK